MKTLKTVLTIMLAAIAITVTAEDKKHDHEKHAAPPKGGRLLEVEPNDAEVVIEKDRSITIYFYDEKMKPVSLGERTVTLIADAKDGKKKIEFEKKGETLASKGNLPDGEGYNLTVQYREKPDSKPKNHRFKLDLAPCEECKHPEYACTCEH